MKNKYIEELDLKVLYILIFIAKFNNYTNSVSYKEQNRKLSPLR